MRFSVIICISPASESAGSHVVTLTVMMSAAVLPRMPGPSPAMARTTSRSETMPAMPPSVATTTTAPMRWRVSVSTIFWTLSAGETVMTSDPFCLRM